MAIANLLKDIQVAEVSLVPKAANKRNFLLFKSEEGEGEELEKNEEEAQKAKDEDEEEEESSMEDEEKATDDKEEEEMEDKNKSSDSETTALTEAINNFVAAAKTINKQTSEEDPMKLEDILKAAAEGDLDNEDAIKEAVAKAELPENKAEAVAAILRMAKAAELPPEFMSTVAQLGGAPAPETSKSNTEKEEDLQKESEKLSPEAQAMLKKQAEEFEAIKKQAEETAAELKKAKEERAVELAIQKARDNYSHLPVKAEEFGPIMKAVEENLDEKQVEVLVEALKAADEAISKSEDFEALRTDLGGTASKLSSMVEELMKSDTDLTREGAIAKALSKDPKLYDEYRQGLGG